MDTLMPIVEQLSNLTLLEASQLARALEARWGVSAQAVAPPPPAPTPPPAPGTFSVVLTGAGPNRLEVFRALRELLGLSLQEARALLDRTPAVLREGLSAEQRDPLVARLTAAGAQLEVR